MRTAIVALVAWLAATPALAAPFVVDAVHQTIETSTLKIQFAADCPERVTSLIYKPFSPTASVLGEWLPWEFSGQMIRGLWAGQGPIFSQSTDSTDHSWQVIAEDANRLVLRIESHATYAGQLNPRVRTDYTFFADSSCYQVDRTAYFSAQPWTGQQLQPYVLRIRAAISSVVQYHLSNGAAASSAYCGGGCQTTNWDHRWLMVQGPAFAATIHNAATNPSTMAAMNDNDSNSASNWTGPITASGNYSTDQHWRLLVHLGTTPTNYALEDAVQTWFDALPPLAVPGTGDIAEMSLALAPNPSPAGATVRFTLPAAGDVDLGVFDMLGRRVATLANGAHPAGAYALRWDGRGALGREADPGVYLVRLRSARGVVARKLVHTR